jgi:hypothetical protein
MHPFVCMVMVSQEQQPDTARRSALGQGARANSARSTPACDSHEREHGRNQTDSDYKECQRDAIVSMRLHPREDLP